MLTTIWAMILAATAAIGFIWLKCRPTERHRHSAHRRIQNIASARCERTLRRAEPVAGVLAGGRR